MPGHPRLCRWSYQRCPCTRGLKAAPDSGRVRGTLFTGLPSNPSKVVCSLGLLPTKLLQSFMYRFCVHLGFIFWGQMVRNATAGSCGYCMFSFIRNCQTVFQSGCTHYIPTNVHVTQFLRVLASRCSDHGFKNCSHPHRCSLVCICISLTASDAHQLFMGLLATCVCSLDGSSSSWNGLRFQRSTGEVPGECLVAVW